MEKQKVLISFDIVYVASVVAGKKRRQVRGESLTNKTNRPWKQRSWWQQGTWITKKQINTKRETVTRNLERLFHRFAVLQQGQCEPRRSDCTRGRSRCVPRSEATVELVEAFRPQKSISEHSQYCSNTHAMSSASSDGGRQTRRERVGVGNRVGWSFYSQRSRVRN